MFSKDEFEFVSYSSASGVSDQPFCEEETRKGKEFTQFIYSRGDCNQWCKNMLQSVYNKTVLPAKDYLTNSIIPYTAATRATTTENKAITLLLLGG